MVVYLDGKVELGLYSLVSDLTALSDDYQTAPVNYMKKKKHANQADTAKLFIDWVFFFFFV